MLRLQVAALAALLAPAMRNTADLAPLYVDDLEAPAGYSSRTFWRNRRIGYTAPLMIPKAKPKAKAPQHPLVTSLLGAIAQIAVEGRMRGYRQPTPPREVHGKKAGAYRRGLQNQWARQRRDAIEEKHRG